MSTPPTSPSFPFTCVEPGCGRLIVSTNRHGWLHTAAAESATVAEARAAAVGEDDDTTGHRASRFHPLGPKAAVDDRPSVLMHPGCPEIHLRLGEVRRCAGRFVGPGDYRRIPLDVPHGVPREELGGVAVTYRAPIPGHSPTTEEL